MFDIIVLFFAAIFYGVVPLLVFITACYYLANFIGSIPDLVSYVKNWWKARFSG